MTLHLQFRLATPEDAPSIRELVEYAFRAEDTRENWTADMELGRNFRVRLEDVLATISHPDKAIIIAVSDNETKDLVASIDVSKREADTARLAMIAVNGVYQQSGVGRQVVDYAEKYCHETWGSTKAGLNAVSTRRELIAWYERRGYRKTGEFSPFPREAFPHLVLAEDLCFVEMEKTLG
ncbi:acyl-CoA N-acyltransferase [Penicillium angulare]|uniref:Acyl-CoA N-acyltransferase n=1 Tax=Penicillium angulare TaxID=116970 RepID=A0A9W9EU63_9EURO|nr:acyl-CoA N-acyltransferase [Penicillium angulare]